MKGETKEERFIRVAEKRVQALLESIRKLSQCSNRRMYAWNEKQLKKIWGAIDRDLKACRERFDTPVNDEFRL